MMDRGKMDEKGLVVGGESKVGIMPLSIDQLQRRYNYKV